MTTRGVSVWGVLAAGMWSLGALGGCSEGGSSGSGPDGGEVQDAGDDAGSEDGGSRDGDAEDGGAKDGSMPTEDPGPLVIVTERETPDTAVQYLHVVDDFPEDLDLDDGQAVELGPYPLVRAGDGAVFVYVPEDATMHKYVVDDELKISRDGRLSFMGLGVTGYDPDTVWVAPDRAFLVDEGTAQIVLWNPETMEIVDSVDIPEEQLERDGLPLQLQQNGVVSGDLAFLSANWRDWETGEIVEGAAFAYFDTTDDTPTLKFVHEDRCAPSVAAPWVDARGDVYLLGDGALGFDKLASLDPTDKPQCVRRVRAGETEFDPDYFVDLQEATGSPGFRSAHFMADGKLLANTWAPEVDLADVADPETSEWYWELPPYFEYFVVDLEEESSTRVKAIERAAEQFSLTLRVHGDNYVQTYRQDNGSDLFRVGTDGKTQKVLEGGQGEDVQYLGRLGAAR